MNNVHKWTPISTHWHWLIETSEFGAYGMSVSANGRQEGGAAVAMTTAISLPYGGGGGKQASNKCQWAVDGDVCSVGRWTQLTTGNIHINKPEKLFNWQKKSFSAEVPIYFENCQYSESGQPCCEKKNEAEYKGWHKWCWKEKKLHLNGYSTPTFKRLFQPKMKMLSLITYLHVVPNL